MVSDLVPEAREDRNGKVTKRWVKKHNAPQASGKLVNAAPTVASPVDRKEFSRRLTEATDIAFIPAEISYLSDKAVLELDEMLPQISKSLADRASLSTWVGPYSLREEEQTGEIALVSRHHRMIMRVPLESTLRAIRGLPHYAGHREFTEAQKQSILNGVAAALAIVPSFIEDKDAFYAAFGGDLGGYDRRHLFLKDEKLVEMLLRRADEADRIYSVMTARGTVDPELIEYLLDADGSMSLIEGAL